MRHIKTRSGSKEHIAHPDVDHWTYCGETVYGAAEVKTPQTAARVVDDLCARCRDAMDADARRMLFEMADEAVSA